jgi:hypothetical protein
LPNWGSSGGEKALVVITWVVDFNEVKTMKTKGATQITATMRSDSQSPINTQSRGAFPASIGGEACLMDVIPRPPHASASSACRE